jgi:hypothetical protein
MKKTKRKSKMSKRKERAVSTFALGAHVDILLSGQDGFERYDGAWVPGVVETVDGGSFSVRLCGFQTERDDKRSEIVTAEAHCLMRPRPSDGNHEWKEGDLVQGFWIAEKMDQMDSWWDAVVVKDGVNSRDKVLIKWVKEYEGWTDNTLWPSYKLRSKEDPEPEGNAADARSLCTLCWHGAADNAHSTCHVCDFHDCGAVFHALCAGYESEPGDDTSTLCLTHLREQGCTAEQLLWQEEKEEEHVKAWLAENSDQWQLVKVKGDGGCTVNSVWKWFQDHKEFRKKAEVTSWNGLVKKIAGGAISIAKDFGSVSEADYKKFWTAVQNNPETLKNRFSEEAAGFWVEAMHGVFPWLRVVVATMAVQGGVMNFPDAFMGYKEEEIKATITLYHWRRFYVGHFDLLLEKG